MAFTGVPSQVVVAYWEEYEYRHRGDDVRADASFWAWEVVDGAARHGSDSVLGLLVALADAARDDAALAYLGAGPVEDLVNGHGERLGHAIEAAADEHPAFAKTLCSINYCAETEGQREVEHRLQRFRCLPG
ncbi:MAG: hypothetical protein M3083_08680 [Actinomycetota bacterium]|nr:hypothetical protein [Actinomycetota bacterium]